MEKRVLFSPVGTHDPMGIIINGKPSEGSMLHIIRHYKPSIVYLYISKELNYGDNRYENAIKKFFPDCEVENIFSNIEENDVNNYDAFMNDFKREIKKIYEKHKGYEILLNIASGTPQMKSSLILEVISNNIKLIPIQVGTPTKKKNFEDHFNAKDLDKIDVEIENSKNRCDEVKVLSFKRSKIQTQIESLINNYEYSAALQIFKEDENAVDLFNDKLPIYLQHCIYRMNSQFSEASKLFSDNGIEILDYSNGDEVKREFFEYFYIMKIKQSKGAITDFLLRITPFITELLYYFLHDKYNLDIDKYILKKSDVVFSIERKHIEKHNKDLLVFLDGLYGNSKFRSTFLNFNTLIDIALFYYDKIDDNNYKGTYGAFKYFSKIEKERNKAAHTMINIDEDFVKSNLNKSSEDLINNCETLLRMIFDYQSNYFIYKSINEEIINLLQETK
ncbi:type III-A CRISPR-associated CARF protein Csm6 [Brachyspira intermedia]|uniref:type III-A CRISPR-associated CARF protein Csm6 n=1 Tax=Brachyspira intermedia TaxID=84377 RepID=UPI0030063B2D